MQATLHGGRRRVGRLFGELCPSYRRPPRSSSDLASHPPRQLIREFVFPSAHCLRISALPICIPQLTAPSTYTTSIYLTLSKNTVYR